MPILKRLTTEFDTQNTRVDLKREEVRVIFKSSKDEWFTLKLRHRKEYIKKFQNYRWKGSFVKPLQ